MGRPTVQYSKAELVAFLEKKCPQALAKFPLPENFSFETHPDGTYLNIGYIDDDRYIVGHKIFANCHGEGMSQLNYKKLQQGQIRGGDVHLVDLLREVLGSPTVPAYDAALRVVVNFIFVWCGRKDAFIDLQHGSELECEPALSVLVRRLENLAPKCVKVVRKYPLD
jgi:hypothetical protein